MSAFARNEKECLSGIIKLEVSLSLFLKYIEREQGAEECWLKKTKGCFGDDNKINKRKENVFLFD
jgi:hypothetical protein